MPPEAAGRGSPPYRAADAIRRHGLRADKRLGQHFLVDPAILARIAAAAGALAGRTVVEVGPGPGGLTAALLAAGADRVVAVERDNRFAPALDELGARWPGRLAVLHADALMVDIAGLADGPVTIVANLPYNVATALLVGWLDRLPAIERCVLMFQREVALRLTAQPRSRDYGRLAVLVQRLTTVERLFDLPPGAFSPPPKVSSSVVRLLPRPDPPPAAVLGWMRHITRAAFAQRRKMLRSSLKAAIEEPEPLLLACGLQPTQRAEELSIADFERLAQLAVSRRSSARS